MILNVIFWLISCAMLVLSILLKVNLAKHHEDVLGHSFETGVNVAIAVSVFNFVIAVFGCCGAIRESKCFLSIYFAINVVILTMCIASIAVNYSKIPKDKASLKKTFEGLDPNSKNYDIIEQAFGCCGAISVCGNFTGGIPVGCGCDQKEENCKQLKDVKGCNTGSKLQPNDYIYSKSCYVITEKYLTNALQVLGGIGIGLMCLTILMMVLSLVVCLNTKKEEEHSI